MKLTFRALALRQSVSLLLAWSIHCGLTRFTCLSCVVHGNYTSWGDWSECDDNFDTIRTRTCLGTEHGGKCDGEPKEMRKCGEIYIWPLLLRSMLIRGPHV